MQAFVYDKHGDANKSNSSIRQVQKPEPLDDDVLIQIHAASLNPIDFKRRNGVLKPIAPEKKWPVGLGYDLSGTVVAVGKNVTEFKQGDEVFSRVESHRSGTVAEFICANKGVVALKPQNVSFVEGAAVPLAAITAWQMLKKAEMEQGYRVFVTGGAGGVGNYAIQFAKHVFGATEVATTASPGAGTDLVTRLGADTIINYREDKFEEKLKDFDICIDCTGESLRAIDVIKDGGKVVSVAAAPTVGALREAGLQIGCVVSYFLNSGSKKILQKAHKKGATYDYLLMKPGTQVLTDIGETIQSGKVKVVVDKVFPLAKAVDAMAYLETGRAKGKVVVEVIPSK